MFNYNNVMDLNEQKDKNLPIMSHKKDQNKY